MNREILERSFEAHQIRTRRGHSGKTFTYVEGAEYIKRLNEAFDGKWSFEIIEHFVKNRDVVVIGRLEAEGYRKTAFGGTSVTANAHTGEPLSLADDLKAAATDALKKAASLFGIGLQLNSSDTSDINDKVVSLPPRSQNPRNTNGGSAQTSKKTLTERQLNAIMAIGRTLGLTSDDLGKQSTASFGAPVKELSKSEASSFIDELRGMSQSAA